MLVNSSNSVVRLDRPPPGGIHQVTGSDGGGVGWGPHQI